MQETIQSNAKPPSCFIAVHAGAGYHSPASAKLYIDVCKRACEVAMSFLKQGYDASRAVALAISVLEESPYTNAGVGSCLNFNGKVECDASVMDKYGFGAVGSVPRFKNPILIALTLLDTQKRGKLSLGRVPPCVLFGKGALQWAANFKLPSCSEEELRTEHGKRLYEKYKKMLVEYDARKNGTIVRPPKRKRGYSGDQSSCSSSDKVQSINRRKYKERRVANRQFFRRQASSDSMIKGKNENDVQSHESDSEISSSGNNSMLSTNPAPSSVALEDDINQSHSEDNQKSTENHETEKDEFVRSRKSVKTTRRVETKAGVKRGKSESDKSFAENTRTRSCCTKTVSVRKKFKISKTVHSRVTSMMRTRSKNILHTRSSTKSVIEATRHTRNEVKKRKQSKHNQMSLDTLDTVGAIALDCNGDLASGVSSGGLLLKYPGRIGQAAMYGCGCWTSYTQPEIAVSTSGCGEHIIKTMFAQRFANDLAQCPMTPESVKRTVVSNFINCPILEAEEEKLIGLVAMRKHTTGKTVKVEIAAAHTAQSFCYGFMHPSQEHAEATISYQPPDKRGKDVFATCFGFEF